MKKARDLFRRTVKKVLLVYRKDSPPALTLARETVEWFKEHGITVYSHPQQKIHKNVSPLKSGAVRKIDLTLVLGGDGTYLEAVRLLQDAPTPVLGVNLGSLGFLTVVRAEDIYHALELTLHGKMQLRRRSLIAVEVRKSGRLRENIFALNDVVIERGPNSQLLSLSVFIDRQMVAPVKADGLIVATPTGSTAYNLAAGGPILHPDVSALVVTSVCPHSLTNRPLLVPDGNELLFRITGRNQEALLTVDGRKVTDLNSEDEVIVKRAVHDHLILRKPTDNYFNLLREKLKFGERA